jgi:hypothetical protein
MMNFVTEIGGMIERSLSQVTCTAANGKQLLKAIPTWSVQPSSPQPTVFVRLQLFLFEPPHSFSAVSAELTIERLFAVPEPIW